MTEPEGDSPAPPSPRWRRVLLAIAKWLHVVVAIALALVLRSIALDRWALPSCVERCRSSGSEFSSVYWGSRVRGRSGCNCADGQRLLEWRIDVGVGLAVTLGGLVWGAGALFWQSYRWKHEDD